MEDNSAFVDGSLFNDLSEEQKEWVMKLIKDSESETSTKVLPEAEQWDIWTYFMLHVLPVLFPVIVMGMLIIQNSST